MKLYSLIDLPKIRDMRGNLTFIEGSRHIPFDIGRVYYIYDVPGGESRGAHAHKELYQLLIAISGSFDVVVDDGSNRETINLKRADYGLLIRPGVWRELKHFSSGSACLVLASAAYDEKDYIRDYEDFKDYVAKSRISKS